MGDKPISFRDADGNFVSAADVWNEKKLEVLFKICDKAKIPRFSMHILRHLFVTKCIESGMKPKKLQMLLDHSNIGITMNLYVHTTEISMLKSLEIKGFIGGNRKMKLGIVIPRPIS